MITKVLSIRIIIVLVFVCLSANTRAANFTVNSNGDTSDAAIGNGICADAVGDCTLRAAVEESNALSSNDVINFAASLTNTTITLTSGNEITISQTVGPPGTLTINGLGADKLTIDGGAGTNRIFFMNLVSVTIRGVTLQGGGASGAVLTGGAIDVQGNLISGTLVLDRVVIRNNIAQRGGGVELAQGVNHRITNSVIYSNSSNICAGLYQDGGTLFVANTTISGNNANVGDAYGGGYCSFGSASATFRNSTIVNNTAGDRSGGIRMAGSSLNLGNTILAGNNAPTEPEISNFTSTTSAGNNFVGDSAGDSTNTFFPIAYQASDIRDQNPMLDVLQNNGGPSPTHALLTGSPAINTGDNAKAVNPFDNSPLTTDQRGYTPRNANGTVDIGGYEFGATQPPTAASVIVSGRVLSSAGKGVSNAYIILTNQRGETRTSISNPFGYYRFEEVPAGEVYVFEVRHKHYQFAPQVVTVAEEINDLNFTAETINRN
jgi:CSLREA domain-containing protein